MLDSKEAVVWCLAFFFTFVVVLMLLIKFWVGSFNKYDQNGMLEDGLDGIDSNDEKASENQIKPDKKGRVESNKNVRRIQDFQQQISLQWSEGGLAPDSYIMFKKF